MNAAWPEFQQAHHRALDLVLDRARAPIPRVARHWVSTERLTWFGATAAHHLVHCSWSFGALKEVAEVPGVRQTVGVFAVSKLNFPGVDEDQLRLLLEQMVPAGTDGATKVFLHRVAMQLATADWLKALQARTGTEVFFFARTDAVELAAATPRWPEHARERVATALAAMHPDFRARCERTWNSPEADLLAAV